MKEIKIISVCGSGAVTSSMVAIKIKDILADEGIRAITVEANPGGAEELINSGSYDLILHTSPLVRSYTTPALNAVGLLTGIGEEEFIAQLITLSHQITDTTS